jgi:hypothetical protein
MTIDLVLRGDTRNYLNKVHNNFIKMVVSPLRDMGYTVRIFTYMWYENNDTTPYDNINNIIGVDGTKLYNKETHYDEVGFRQWDVFCHIIEDAQTRGDSDLLFICRFDTIWKEPITNWLRVEDESWDFMLPWKEYEKWWKNHNRVSDTFHAIRVKDTNLQKSIDAIRGDSEWNNIRQFLNSINSVERQGISNVYGARVPYNIDDWHFKWYIDSTVGHHIYRPLVREGLNVVFSTDGYYDSNTYNQIGMFGTTPTLTKNPIYLLVHYSGAIIYHHNDVNIGNLIK